MHVGIAKYIKETYNRFQHLLLSHRYVSSCSVKNFCLFSTKLHLGLKVSFNCDKKLNAIAFQLITKKNNCASSPLYFYQCTVVLRR